MWGFVAVAPNPAWAASTVVWSGCYGRADRRLDETQRPHVHDKAEEVRARGKRGRGPADRVELRLSRPALAEDGLTKGRLPDLVLEHHSEEHRALPGAGHGLNPAACLSAAEPRLKQECAQVDRVGIARSVVPPNAGHELLEERALGRVRPENETRVIRILDRSDASGPEHSPHLTQSAERIADVLDHKVSNRRIEVGIGEGQLVDRRLLEPKVLEAALVS